MKSLLIKLCIISVLILFFGCINREKRMNNIYKIVMNEACKLDNNAEISFDSVSVFIKPKNTDSLSFYKNNKLVGSIIIKVEEVE